MKRVWMRPALLATLGLSLTACGHAPSFNLLGSYFPAWMVCLPLAILLTVGIRFFVQRLDAEDYFRPLLLSYIAVWAFFTFTLWLLFFG